MPRRRSPGEGSIYWNKTHRYWEGCIAVGTKPDGKPDNRYARSKLAGRAGEREVEDAFREIMAGVAEEAAELAEAAARYTMWECIVDWHAWVVATQPRTSRKTADRYLSQLAKHVRPLIGDMQLADCDVDVIAGMLEAIAPSLGKASLSNILNSLRRAINYARRQKKISRNDAEAVDLPEPGHKPRDWDFLPQETVESILEQEYGKADEPVSRMYALMTTGFFVGLRPGEIRALRWADVDLDEGVLSVVRYLKTGSSRRAIRLPRRVLEALAFHRATYGDHVWVFVHEDGSQLDKDSLAWRVAQVFKAAGLPHLKDPYVMRHTFASIMDHHDVEHRKIADMMGHKNLATFQTVYRHRLRPVITETADLLDAILG